MTVYGKRDTPAYAAWDADPSFAQNQHILNWWSAAHDEALQACIIAWRWGYGWKVTEALRLVTPGSVLEAWRKTDPVCRRYNSENVLMYFGIARAQQRGYESLIRPSETKACVICAESFREDSLPMPFMERLGPGRIDACSPCLGRFAVQGSGRQDATNVDAKSYLTRLAEVLGRVPPQSFGEGMSDLLSLRDDERRLVYPVLIERVATARIKSLFGSHLAALTDAGLVTDGRHTARGIQSISKCRHVCLSLGEKTICESLMMLGIEHSKEPHYPEGNWRADWKVGDVFVEYLGLSGDPDYDERTEAKRTLAARHGLKVLFLVPADLVSSARLVNRLERLRPVRPAT